MLALALSLALFVFWLFIGYAILGALRSQRHLLRNALLSPMVGVSATVLPVFLANRAGIPVKYFAVYATVALLLAAVMLAARFRPVFPLRRFRPFAGIFLLALALCAWPMLLYGFDWLAYCNGDMLTLSNAAQYLLHHGLFDVPNTDDLAAGRDFSLYAWYQYAVGMHRVGNEMLLAWFAGTTGLRPDQVYMSLTAALELALISGTGALVLRTRSDRVPAMVTCGLLALSALGTQAVVNQLPSQIGGLAFLAVSAALLLRPYEMPTRSWAVREAALLALVMSAMLLYYPEMMPFLAIAFAIFALLGVLRGGVPFKPMLLVLGAGAALCIVLLNTELASVFVHVMSAVGGRGTRVDIAYSQFAFFLKPIGLAIFWGLSTFNFSWPEPWTSGAIIIGGLLMLAAMVMTVWMALRAVPAALICVVMAALGAVFFVSRSDFGLFKLAFYIQPFLVATVVVAWFALVRSPVARMVPLAFLALAGCEAQTFYTVRSADFARASGSIYRASETRMKSQIQAILESHPGVTFVMDSPNFRLTHLFAVMARGHSFIPTVHLERFIGVSPLRRYDAQRVFAVHQALRPQVVEQVREIDALEEKLDERRTISGSFDLKRPGEVSLNDFTARRIPAGENVWFVGPAGVQSIFNRRQYSPEPGSALISLPLSKTSNYLSFVHSEMGQYFFRDLHKMSFWQLENDYFYPDTTMAASGRVHLFQVLNPKPEGRIALEFTSTLNLDQEYRLPPASAIGDKRVAFPLVGRGSARVFSPPLRPQWIKGSAFISVDMNAPVKPLAIPESGLRALYGADLRLDTRSLVGFVRDISLIDESEYQNLAPPAKLNEFPKDLANRALEYSGVYEEGWLGEEAYFVLGQKAESRSLQIKGLVPRFAEDTVNIRMHVSVDGREMLVKPLTTGEFDVAVPVPGGAARRRIDLRFDGSQRIPGFTARVVTVLLKSIGFEAVEPVRMTATVEGAK